VSVAGEVLQQPGRRFVVVLIGRIGDAGAVGDEFFRGADPGISDGLGQGHDPDLEPGGIFFHDIS